MSMLLADYELLFLEFALDLTLAVELAWGRQVDVGIGRGIKMGFSARVLSCQASFCSPAKCGHRGEEIIVDSG